MQDTRGLLVAISSSSPGVATKGNNVTIILWYSEVGLSRWKIRAHTGRTVKKKARKTPEDIEKKPSAVEQCQFLPSRVSGEVGSHAAHAHWVDHKSQKSCAQSSKDHTQSRCDWRKVDNLCSQNLSWTFRHYLGRPGLPLWKALDSRKNIQPPKCVKPWLHEECRRESAWHPASMGAERCEVGHPSAITDAQRGSAWHPLTIMDA